MLSSELSTIILDVDSIKSHFLGCYSSDNLPKAIKKNQFAIVNTDISTGIGKHWYAIFKYSNCLLEVFDSLGIDHDKKKFLQQNFSRGTKEIEFNKTQFQKSDTNSCGKFVLYFIFNRLFNLDHCFEDLLEEIFCPDLDENEKKVEEFYIDIIDNEDGSKNS